MLWFLQPLVDKLEDLIDVVTALVGMSTKQSKQLEEQAQLIDRLIRLTTAIGNNQVDTLKRIISLDRKVSLLVLPIPGPATIRLIGEKDHDMLQYQADLVPAKPDASKIAKQRIVTMRLVVVNAFTAFQYLSQLIDIATDTITFEVPRNKDIKVTLTCLDSDGNESAPSEQTFFSKDTIPPDAPGAFGAFSLLAETETPDPIEPEVVPEPTPEPVPEPEPVTPSEETPSEPV